MNTHNTPKTTFAPLQQVASQLGVPSAWLKAEAVAGRVPCLRVKRRIFFNLALAERALFEKLQESRGGDDYVER